MPRRWWSSRHCLKERLLFFYIPAACHTAGIGTFSSGVLENSSGVLENTSGVLKISSGVLKISSGVFLITIGVIPEGLLADFLSRRLHRHTLTSRSEKSQKSWKSPHSQREKCCPHDSTQLGAPGAPSARGNGCSRSRDPESP